MSKKPKYWTKQESPLYQDFAWNFPEQKTNTVHVLGGNSQNFATIIKTAEFLSQEFPLKSVEVYLPDALRRKVPPLPNFHLLESTHSGSFAKSTGLDAAVQTGDFTILAGDFSKNSATVIAVTNALKGENLPPVIITRDTVDLLTPEASSLFEMNTPFFLLASMAQLQKIFRNLYYPRPIMLSQPLAPVVETLHKFTLSYEQPIIITLHQEHIIAANLGHVITTPLAKTQYSPTSIWDGTLAAEIAAYALWNHTRPLEASAAAIIAKKAKK